MLETLFIGTAPFGLPVLDELASRTDVRLRGVISQPDRRRGRGQKLQSTPISRRARELDLSLFQPENINQAGPGCLEQYENLDVIFIVAYGQLLSPEIFSYPDRGTFNFHASLLPRWRGAAPIRHALLAGDETTGVSLFKLQEELDAGPVCVQQEIEVGKDETYGELYRRLSNLNVRVLEDFLDRLKADSVNCSPQEGKVTYASQISREDARVDWADKAEEIERQVRAFCPDPGAYTEINGERCTIYSACCCQRKGDPGRLLAASGNELVIAAGKGALKLESIQPSGSRKMDTGAFLAGRQELEQGENIINSGE